MTRLAAVDPESLPRTRTPAQGVTGGGDLVQVSAQTRRRGTGLLDEEAVVAIEAEALE